MPALLAESRFSESHNCGDRRGKTSSSHNQHRTVTGTCAVLWRNVLSLEPLVRWQFEWWLPCGGDSPGQYSARSDFQESGCEAAEWSPARLREVPVKIKCQTPRNAPAFCSSQQLCKCDSCIIWPRSARSELRISIRLIISRMTHTWAAQIILQNSYSPILSISTDLVPCAEFTLVFTKHKLSCGAQGTAPPFQPHTQLAFQKQICNASYTKMLLW